MFGMGMGELIVILVVALLVLGPDKIPEAAKAIGKGMRELRKQTRAVQETIEQDEELGSTVRDLKSALRGEDPRPIIKPPSVAPVGRTPLAPPAAPTATAALGTPASDAPAPAAPVSATPNSDDGSKSGTGSGTA
jgi:sec-independent protein translocase protein TatB